MSRARRPVDHPAARLELLDEGNGDLLRRGRDYDAIERGVLRRAEIAVAHPDRHVPVTEPLQGSPGVKDADHLRSFRAEYGGEARAGLLLHAGDAIESLLPDVLAVPWWRMI